MINPTGKRIALNIFLIVYFCLSPSAVCAVELTNSVVKVFVTSNSIDYYRPWQSRGVSSSAGSGAIIQGNKILTNAHVVADQTFIQVKKNDDPKKYAAEVEAIGHDCDLALLRVTDASFFEDTTALSIGSLPKLQDTVTVLGYPQGGDKLSITEGVVSRIEIISYSLSRRKLLTVQIDAAINPGNSGGPVIQNGELVGIAMQVFHTGQNIGYMIPPPIINHFFKDLDDGAYDGFPIMGIDYNTTENLAMRRYYNIEEQKGGILVTRVLPHSSADKAVHEGDAILSIDGIPIGEDGTFAFRGNERLSMPHLVTIKQINEQVGLKIIRNGKETEVTLQLTPFKPLVPYPQHYEKPPFYIYGGMVFTVLSADLLQSWGNRWWEKAPLDFTYQIAGSGRLNFEEKEDVVVLLNVLPDQINVGYHGQGNQIISTINGQSFSSFKAFVILLNQVKLNEPFTVFKSLHNAKYVLKNEGIDAVTKEILERNNIPYQYSDDVGSWLSE